MADTQNQLHQARESIANLKVKLGRDTEGAPRGRGRGTDRRDGGFGRYDRGIFRGRDGRGRRVEHRLPDGLRGAARREAERDARGERGEEPGGEPPERRGDQSMLPVHDWILVSAVGGVNVRVIVVTVPSVAPVPPPALACATSSKSPPPAAACR